MSKPRVFDNNLNLPEWVLFRRSASADPQIIIKSYDAFDAAQQPLHHYVTVDSILTDSQIVTALSTPQTQAETTAYSQFIESRASILAIPSWSTWTEAEALTWEQTNIGARITTARSSLPATLTLATARTAIIGIITILDNVQILLVALIRMIVAIRNKVF